MNNANKNIIACVDGSVYADSVVAHAAWASQRLDAPIQLLHLHRPNSEYSTSRDLSGTLAPEGRTSLLEKLTQMDEERGRLDLQKGNLILDHAKEVFEERGIAAGKEMRPSRVEAMHRRGSLVEAIDELEENAQLIVMGKRGEHADFNSMHLGSNLERTLRAAHTPVLVTARTFKDVKHFTIAYDGGRSTVKAVNYVASSPLFKDATCHLLKVGTDNGKNRDDIEQAAAALRQGGLQVETHLLQGDADDEILGFVKEQKTDMLIMGAYGHSHIRTLIIGSTTTNVVRASLVSVLMFR